MPTLPTGMIRLLSAFAPLFSKRVWRHAQLLLVGAILAQALLCTDLDADPEKILSWFVMRWQLEVTFQQMRRHLGFETHRQCSELAIRRTTPALLWGCSRW